MLNVKSLETQLKQIYSTILPPAVEQVFLSMQPTKTAVGEELAKQAAEIFDDMVSQQLAEMMAAAIDYYVRNITITGTVITSGSPVTQTARIVPSPTPITAGKIPNTLGIS